MNVMLVDGDPDNIKNFRAYIKTAFPAVRVTGAFSDAAKDILPVIGEVNPQLIIADIKFFGGVRFMRFKEIHEAFPDVRFVVYGTYNESDYMKRAREFGVLDFMYRPVKPAELSRCLEQALKHFRKAEEKTRQTQALAQNYQERIFQYEEIFLRGLLDGSIRQDHEIRDGFEYFAMPSGGGFSVFFLRIDHYRAIALTLTEKEKHLLIFKILHITQEALRETNALPFIKGFNEVAVILCGPQTMTERVTLCEQIKQQVYEQADTRVTVGMGRRYEEAADIAVSAREADAAYRYRYLLGYHSVIPIEFAEPGNTITYRYPAEREQRLVHAVAIGDDAYSQQVLRELFDALSMSGPLPANLIANTVMNIVFCVSRYLCEQNLPMAAQVMRYFPITDILKLTGLEDGFTFMETNIAKFCQFIGQYNEQMAKNLHKATKAYIGKHYAQHFSAAKTALHLNTTPENMSRVFAEKERVPLMEYVMRVRIEEARALLKDETLDEEAIGSKVGFDNVRYFRSVFKKYQGETPAEYRGKTAGTE